MVVSVLVAPIVEGFVIHPIYAQTNISIGNMTDAMVSLARFHLRAADTALANGNSTEALHQPDIRTMFIALYVFSIYETYFANL